MGTFGSRMTLTAVLVAALSTGSLVRANDAEFAEMSLDEFLNMEITSVAKKAQRLVEAPSAIFVITAEDIRRSGFTSLPEVLRLAPGMQVARQDSNTWGITARGFNNEFANKLLVMIDGRSIYTPLFSGTYWDINDVMLEDIERIEVIRGPGATVWGANAINGVINIITRKAKEAEGSMFTALHGSEDTIAAFRHGGKLTEDLAFRFSGRTSRRDDSEFAGGGDAGDEWQLHRGSLRFDWTPNSDDSYGISGDWYVGDAGYAARADAPLGPLSGIPGTFTMFSDSAKTTGGNGLFRWNHRFSETSNTEVSAILDQRNRKHTFWEEKRRQVDLSFQHNVKLGDTHDVVWGVGARGSWSRTTNSDNNIRFSDTNTADTVYNAFAQDEVALSDQFKLTYGSKVSRNSYTGWEFQPSVRGLYELSETQQLWAAFSRGVRTPSQAERELTFFRVLVAPSAAIVPSPPNPCPNLAAPCPAQLVGNSKQESEVANTYELGYRMQPSSNVSLDFTTFLMDYENLAFFTAPSPTTNPLSLMATNGGSAWSWGFEAFGQWKVNPWWRLTGSYSGFNLRVREGTASGATPAHQVQVHSYMNLPGNVELDLATYFQGRVDLGTNLTTGLPMKLGKDIRFDVRLGWHITPSLEISAVAQNLFDKEDTEWITALSTQPTSEIERAFYGKITWSF